MFLREGRAAACYLKPPDHTIGGPNAERRQDDRGGPLSAGQAPALGRGDIPCVVRKKQEATPLGLRPSAARTTPTTGAERRPSGLPGRSAENGACRPLIPASLSLEKNRAFPRLLPPDGLLQRTLWDGLLRVISAPPIATAAIAALSISARLDGSRCRAPQPASTAVAPRISCPRAAAGDLCRWPPKAYAQSPNCQQRVPVTLKARSSQARPLPSPRARPLHARAQMAMPFARRGHSFSLL